MQPKLSLLFTFLTLPLFSAQLRLAIPQGWECVTDQSQLPKKVQMLAICPKKSKFTPSINIASEETDQNLNEYMETAQLYHESEGITQVTKLGQIPTKAGPAQLIQIDRTTDFGQVRFLQAALIQNEMAYVVTATCLKDEFSTYCGSFFESIKSLDLEP